MVSDFRLQPNLTSVENVASEIPAFDFLKQNYPNPFNPSTTIKFDLSAASEVTLNIYNMKGQLVRQLLQEKLSAGSHSFTWDAKDDHAQQLPSGLYVSRLQAGDFVQHRKMLLIK
ncbi:T9SS type A sorting domain-containing protein [candidate division KSB1 bacterium]|nr:T9SS type A sorting domain-containing protein [candidate division KSB1 bacterium]